MRIALYHNLHSGGAKRVVVEHLHRLTIRHEVSLFCLATADQTFAANGRAALPATIANFRHLPLAHSPFGRINPMLRLLDLMRLDRVAQNLAMQIDQMSFDVALVHPCQVTQAPQQLRWLKTPTLYYCHELPRRLYETPVLRPYNVRSRWRRTLDRIDLLSVTYDGMVKRIDREDAKRAKYIVCNSLFTRRNITQAYDRVAEVCYPAVAADSFRPAQMEREPFVLSVGALTPNKGFDFIIEALGSLPIATRPSFVIVSNYQEPMELQYLQALADQRNVRIECRVNVSEAELRTLYAQTACVVYAPLHEPFGLVPLEAMASEAAVVGVAEGGITETITHEFNGLLVPRDPIAFGDAVWQLLSDPGRARQLGQTARRNVLEHWSWEQHIERLETLLSEAAK